MLRTRRLSIYVGRAPRCRRRVGESSAFTIIELVVVIATILILVGVVLAAAGYVQKKGARARAETEIAALSAALESYKADNGIYPRGPTAAMNNGAVTIRANATDQLNARVTGDPTTDPASSGTATYRETSLYVYTQLSGDTNCNAEIDNTETANRVYFNFKPEMLYTITTAQGNQTISTVAFIRDPFGNSYGYSTIQAATPAPNSGYNPTYDLWSTAGLTAAPDDTVTAQWIKNW